VASRRPRSGGMSTSSAALRGALLIGVAIALGAVLLAQGFGDNGFIGSGSNTSTTVKHSDTSTTTAPAAQAHDPATVRVLVLNGSGKTGIAKATSDQLKAANYTTLDPANAANGATVDTSIVYFQAGYDADAQAIAAKLGLAPSAAQALPVPPPPTVGDPKDANVVVLVGADAPVAGGPGASGATTTTAAAN